LEIPQDFHIVLPNMDIKRYSNNIKSLSGQAFSSKSIIEISAGIFIFCTLSVVAPASMINFDTYRTLDQGMSEGEILYYAGPPDKEIYFEDPVHRSPESIKQYFYIPLPGDQDPQLTIITFEKGIVIDIKRVQVSVPTRASQGGQIHINNYNLLRAGMFEGQVLARAGFPDKEIKVVNKIDDPFALVKQLR
jgi:hypothetical protein